MKGALSSAIVAGMAFCAGVSGQVVKRQSGNLPPVGIFRIALSHFHVLIPLRSRWKAMHSTRMVNDSIFVVLLINQVKTTT